MHDDLGRVVGDPEVVFPLRAIPQEAEPLLRLALRLLFAQLPGELPLVVPVYEPPSHPGELQGHHLAGFSDVASEIGEEEGVHHPVDQEESQDSGTRGAQNHGVPNEEAERPSGFPHRIPLYRRKRVPLSPKKSRREPLSPNQTVT